MDYVVNKLRWIKKMVELYKPFEKGDYEAMENISSNIISLNEAKSLHLQLIKEIRNSEYTSKVGDGLVISRILPYSMVL
jgi:hypothetical protein